MQPRAFHAAEGERVPAAVVPVPAPLALPCRLACRERCQALGIVPDRRPRLGDRLGQPARQQSSVSCRATGEALRFARRDEQGIGIARARLRSGSLATARSALAGRYEAKRIGVSRACGTAPMALSGGAGGDARWMLCELGHEVMMKRHRARGVIGSVAGWHLLFFNGRTRPAGVRPYIYIWGGSWRTVAQ